MQNRIVIHRHNSIHWPAGQFGYDIVYNVSVRHQLIAVFGFVEFLPNLGFVEKHHSSLFRNLKFLRKLNGNIIFQPQKWITPVVFYIMRCALISNDIPPRHSDCLE